LIVVAFPDWKTSAPGRIFCKMNNSVAVAVVAGAIIIAASMAVIFRYEVSPIGVSILKLLEKRFDLALLVNRPVRNLAVALEAADSGRR
jgi:hypothetical protein